MQEKISLVKRCNLCVTLQGSCQNMENSNGMQEEAVKR